MAPRSVRIAVETEKGSDRLRELQARSCQNKGDRGMTLKLSRELSRQLYLKEREEKKLDEMRLKTISIFLRM